MSDFLFGGEQSGTPIETREAATGIGGTTSELFGGGATIEEIMARLQSTTRLGGDAAQGILGLNPQNLGIEETIQGLLASPGDRTKGLFAAMEPFEARETERQVGGLREAFGSVGGRFSRNLLEGETELRTELAQGFGLQRQQGLLEAAGIQVDTLRTVFQGLLQSAQQGSSEAVNILGILTGHASAGAPTQTTGIVPGLVGVGAGVAGAHLLPKA